MTLIEALGVIASSSLVTAIATKFLGKSKENAEIKNMWKQGQELDLKFSEYVKKEIDTQVKEKTKELREAIADNEVRHHKEIRDQADVFALKYLKLEEQSERRIHVLEMKMELLEKKLDNEMTLRIQCVERLGILTDKLNKYENKK